MKTRILLNLELLTMCAVAAFGLWATSAFAGTGIVDTGGTCYINGSTTPTNCTTIEAVLATSNAYVGEPAGYAPLPDGNSPTACLVNPSASPWTGTITMGSPGCDIGVYYGPYYTCKTVSGTTAPVSCSATNGPYASAGGSVSGSSISGENYFGVLVNEAPVTLIENNISAGTETYSGTLSGAPTSFGPTPVSYVGIGILYINGATCATTAGNIGCLIEDNTVTLPGATAAGFGGKNGIEAKNPGTAVTIARNTILGSGPNANVGQNGIEIGDGAIAIIRSNTVGAKGSGLNYTGTQEVEAIGINIYGGSYYDNFGMFEGPNYTTGIEVKSNTVTDCDIGVFLDNNNKLDDQVFAATNNTITGNLISNDLSSSPYATAIMIDSGSESDKVSNNRRWGSSY